MFYVARLYLAHKDLFLFNDNYKTYGHISWKTTDSFIFMQNASFSHINNHIKMDVKSQNWVGNTL